MVCIAVRTDGIAFARNAAAALRPLHRRDSPVEVIHAQIDIVF
jgi:hypothetical protein